MSLRQKESKSKPNQNLKNESFILNGRCLLIPDVHQDYEFLEMVFSLEKPDEYDHVIFLGDFFDGGSEHTKNAESVEGMLRTLRELRLVFSDDKINAVMGNHDLKYLRNWEFIKKTAEAPNSKEMMRYTEEGISVVTAGAMLEPEDIDNFCGPRLWEDEDWEWLQPFFLVNGHLISHAGVHSAFWPKNKDKYQSLDILKELWNDQLNAFLNGEYPSLLSAGKARGGQQPVGGLVWCDWNEEFDDGIPFPQIVGHTAGWEPIKKGRSWCIDCGQSYYAVLEETGELKHFSC